MNVRNSASKRGFVFKLTALRYIESVKVQKKGKPKFDDKITRVTLGQI